MFLGARRSCGQLLNKVLIHTETFLCLVSHTACHVNTSACRPLDSASASQRQPRPVDAPSHLVRWRLFSCRLVVVPQAVTCLCLMSPFVAQPRHASILDPPCLFVPAGYRTSSHHLRLSTRHRLTTGCVVAITNEQALFLLQSICRHLCLRYNCDCRPHHSSSSWHWRCNPHRRRRHRRHP